MKLLIYFFSIRKTPFVYFVILLEIFLFCKQVLFSSASQICNLFGDSKYIFIVFLFLFINSSFDFIFANAKSVFSDCQLCTHSETDWVHDFFMHGNSHFRNCLLWQIHKSIFGIFSYFTHFSKHNKFFLDQKIPQKNKVCRGIIQKTCCGQKLHATPLIV